MPPMPARISLIAAAPPDLQQVRALCASLSTVARDGFELIAAGPGMSPQLSQELAAACAGHNLAFGLVNEQHLDLNGALNQALARARGEVVGLIPAYCALSPSFGSIMLDLTSKPALSGYQGECLAWPGESKASRLAAQESEFYGLASRECLAAQKQLALKAGGLDDLPRRLQEMGRELEPNPDLAVKEPMPDSWAGMWRRQMGLGGRVRDLKLQQLLLLVCLLLILTLGPLDPQRALSLAAICLLLLYPLNRPFIRHIGQNHPSLLNSCLIFCLWRPFGRLAGGLAAALGRFQG